MRISGIWHFRSRERLNEEAGERLLEEHGQIPDGPDFHSTGAKCSTNNRYIRSGNAAWTMAKLVTFATCATALLVTWIYSAMHFRDEGRCESGESASIRREWRSLTSGDRRSYIAALQCLRNSHSHIYPTHTQMSRWDDFAWTHYQVGFIAHDAACFLSWHRWFIALFESSLRTDCGYSGPMPYWDWTLDWEHPELASIFDDKFGLGGNGDKMHTSTADGAWCVESGPFAGAQIPFDYSAVAGEEVFLNAQGQNTSFCLSRKFALGNSFDASQLAPQHVSWVLSQRGYVKFLMELEEGPHNTIPFGINGTFLTLYAPEDPIFFLHHMQLDRLWWSWQKSRPENARAYNGPSTSQTTAVAKLTDSLPFGNLSEDVIVKDIIDTKRGRLCYEYDEVAA